MELNRKQKFDMTLTAITVDHKENKDHKKAYETFGKCGNQYMIFEENFESEQLYRSLMAFLTKKDTSVNIDVDSFLKIIKDEEKICSLFTVILSAVEYVEITPWTMKTSPKVKSTHNIIVSNIKDYQEAYDKNLILAKAQSFTRRLQDMPSNYMYPGSFVEEVKKHFHDVKNVKIQVKERSELEKMGMNLLVGVGKSAHEAKNQPRLMTIEYIGDASSKTKYAYVGKGVCFDAGGYSLKPSPHMRWMKYDMSGAAIMAGTIYAIAKNKIKANVVAVMPLVLNLIDQDAQRVDDVIKSYSGKTVEIDNTDAEGRLILADSLTYAAKDLKATHLFDAATLTGAMIFSLGETYSGVWSTCDCTWKKVTIAAEKAGELVWRLPFHQDFIDLMKSDYADVANSCNSKSAGSSRAACFLKEFTLGANYTHFDVAATADKGNTGTGIMVRTFYKLAMDQSEECCKNKSCKK